MKVFLLGFMGTGKSYWGKIWAQQNDQPFYDLDSLIEDAQQNSIATIFEKEGEPYFRQLERATLVSFSSIGDGIIACGGGTPCFNGNMNWMNENGITIFLHASPQYIYARVLEEKDKRPLLKKLNQAELLFFIEQKLKEREPFYQQAQLMLPVEELSATSLQQLYNQPSK